jgi:hypothetical protein
MNDRILQLQRGEEFVCKSADFFNKDELEQTRQYPVELLNTLLPAGLPPHRLAVKTGSPVVFLRNLSRKLGMMNGTRGCVARSADSVDFDAGEWFIA